MKRILNIVSIVCLVALSLNLAAQKNTKGDGKKAAATEQKAKENKLYAYLGHSDIRDGKVPKKVFDSLLRQGVTAKDSLGQVYKVDGFMFNYGERNLYEDSVGNLMVMTDMLSEYCPGDTLSTPIKRLFLPRTKAGDTAYIDQVKVQTPEGQKLAKGMRLILTK